MQIYSWLSLYKTNVFDTIFVSNDTNPNESLCTSLPDWNTKHKWQGATPSGVVVSIPASYSVGLEFGSQTELGFSWLIYFVVFPNSSTITPLVKQWKNSSLFYAEAALVPESPSPLLLIVLIQVWRDVSAAIVLMIFFYGRRSSIQQSSE
jgi:hypothetical protein